MAWAADVMSTSAAFFALIASSLGPRAAFRISALAVRPEFITTLTKRVTSASQIRLRGMGEVNG